MCGRGHQTEEGLTYKQCCWLGYGKCESFPLPQGRTGGCENGWMDGLVLILEHWTGHGGH